MTNERIDEGGADFDVSDRATSLLIAGAPIRNASIPPSSKARVGLGERWCWETRDRGMTADIEVAEDSLDVCLCFRADDFDDADWAAFQVIPGVVSVLVTPLIAWFVVDFAGVRLRAPLPLHRDRRTASEIRRLLCEEGSECNLLLFGVSGTTVRSQHAGVSLDRIWEMLVEAVALPMLPDDELYLEALAEYANVSMDLMFAEAMQRYIEPRP